MRFLVTGSEGFIGSNLSERLERDGHMVFGFDLKSGRDLKKFTQIRRGSGSSSFPRERG